jgi:hypothetical protein
MQTIRITYTLSAQDFIDAHRMRRQENPVQRWSMRILYVLVALISVAGVLMLAVEPSRETVQRVLPLFIFVAVWLWFVRWFPSRYARRQFESHAAAQLEQTTEFSESGILTRSAQGGESLIPWKAVRGFVETDRLFVLYVSPTLFVLYPKRVVGDGELQGLRELFARKIQSQS